MTKVPPEVDIFLKNESQIPEKWRLEKPYSITSYLCGGSLIEHTGKTTTV
jgi:hypothetical protein